MTNQSEAETESTILSSDTSVITDRLVQQQQDLLDQSILTDETIWNQLNDAQLDLEVELESQHDVPNVSGSGSGQGQIVLVETDNYGAPLISTIVSSKLLKLVINWI